MTSSITPLKCLQLAASQAPIPKGFEVDRKVKDSDTGEPSGLPSTYNFLSVPSKVRAIWCQVFIERTEEPISGAQSWMLGFVENDEKFDYFAIFWGIPVIGLANSDCDISDVAFPIPGNDTNIKSIGFFVDEIAGAYTEGIKARAVEKQE